MAKGRKADIAADKELFSFVPEKFRSAIWIGLLLVTIVGFFAGPIFGGEYMGADDNVSWEAYRPYLSQVSDAGEAPQWMPYVFSGMPGVAAFMVTGDRSWDLSMVLLQGAQSVFSFANPDIMRVLFFYFILGCGVFALMRRRGMRRSIAFFSAFATVFSAWIIVWIMIGHNTKPMVLAFLPWVILFADDLIDRWSLLSASLLVLSVHFLLESAHPQTALYGAMLVVVWMLTELGYALYRKNRERLAGVIRATLVGLAAAVFAVGMGWDRNAPSLFEYNEYSTRGADPIFSELQPQQDQYQYSIAWSYDVDETFTFIVPTYFGFGRLPIAFQGRPEEPLPTYWGNDNSTNTDAGHYMGIIVLILALFGFWRNRHIPMVVGLAIAGLLGLVLSWGGNFPLVYDIFYNVFPLFDKFRAPSQLLVMLEFVGPILAGFGAASLLAAAKEPASRLTTLARNFRFGSIGAVAFALIGLVVGGSYASAMAGDTLLQSIYGGTVPTDVIDAVYTIVRTDWLLTALFAGVFCFLASRFVAGKMGGHLLMAAVIVMTAVDLWRVDARAMIKNQPKAAAFAVYTETEADRMLKTDTTTYRVADVTRGPTHPAYHLHQHIGGYSAAKMRRYQDLMDITAQGSTSMPGPGVAWDILNTKYLISPQPAAATDRQVGPNLFLRTSTMPRAWFVNRVEVLDDKAVLQAIAANGFDPKEVAYVSESVGVSVDVQRSSTLPAADEPDMTVADESIPPNESGDATDATANLPWSDPNVVVSSWRPHEVSLSVTSKGTGFLMVSEIYYPPGWKASIDGEAVETIRADYLLRGLIIPDGEHTVHFIYESENHDTGTTVSLVLNILVLGMVAFGVFQWYRRREDGFDVSVAEASNE